MAQITVGITDDNQIVLQTVEGENVTYSPLTPGEADHLAAGLAMAAAQVRGSARPSRIALPPDVAKRIRG